MEHNTGNESLATEKVRERADTLLKESQLAVYKRTDRLFAGLMVFQWVMGSIAALVISPRAWVGQTSHIHIHVWAALLLGGAITFFPVLLAVVRPGAASTRYVIAAGQMLMSGLLIHLTGGRIETHFHVFGSLAFLAFYRDWRVFIPATLVVAADHFVRGVYWPQSVFGVLTASHWRWVEHAAWVIFENIFLIQSCLRSTADMRENAITQAELEAVSEKAKGASRAKSEFLANMSHEIRTPLNGIMGMTEILMDTELSPEQTEYLNMVKGSSDSLLQVINDILDFSKIEAGKLDLDPIAFELRDSLTDTMKLMSVRAHQKGLEMVCHVRPDVPDRVVGDPTRLRQILVNLIGNAVKFTDNGEVVVSAELEAQSGNHVTLHFSVRDTGIGIPAEKQRAIFESFTQVDGSSTRKHGGTGLGLTISSRLAEMMGGRIWVESESGKGSTFHFQLRFELPTAVEDHEKDLDLSPEFEGLAVLIVDDNRTNSRILEEMVANWGMRPTVADSGQMALAALNVAKNLEGTFPLILIDAHMPEMDGFTLAERIISFREFRASAIIMLTSAGQAGDAKRCRELGIAAYLNKPVGQSELLDAITTAMRNVLKSSRANTVVTRHSLREYRKNLKILLAEDNLVNQTLAARLLEKRGHAVTVVGNGKLALAALEKEKFDVVLMDVQMPELDGFETTAAIREKERSTGVHIPIIAMTAHAMKGDRENCLAAGMDGYISKPIKGQQLVELVEAFQSSRAGSDDRIRASGPSKQPFDAAVLLERVGGSRELCGEVVDAYLSEAAILLNTVWDAIAEKDARRLARTAHTLKGAIATFGANEALSAAVTLEQIGKSGNLEDAVKAAKHLNLEMDRLEKSLAAFSKVRTEK